MTTSVEREVGGAGAGGLEVGDRKDALLMKLFPIQLLLLPTAENIPECVMCADSLVICLRNRRGKISN